MTEIEVKVKKAEVEKKDTRKKGVYLATFTNADDRLLFFDKMGNLEVIIDTDGDEVHVQLGQDKRNYTNFKKVKKLKIEVEL